MSSEKSTLNLLNNKFKYKEAQLTVSSVDNPRQVARANIKLRLLVGVYPLQVVRFKMKKATTEICQLCKSSSEDITHFLLACEPLSEVRRKYIHAFISILPPECQEQSNDSTFLTHLLIDPTHPAVECVFLFEREILERMENISRDFLFAMHIERNHLLSC